MFGFKKCEEKNVWTCLTNTKLRLPLMEIRICEFAVIEESARCWLKSVAIDYNALEEHCAWIVLIGALIAMDKADESPEQTCGTPEGSAPRINAPGSVPRGKR